VVVERSSPRGANFREIQASREVEGSDARRLAAVDRLRDVRDRGNSPPLAQVVSTNLGHLWATGGRSDATQRGRSPELIAIRNKFLLRPGYPGGDGGEGAVQRLVKSDGLQLRLELLLLFDAQCRYDPGKRVQNVRRIAPRADEDFTSWSQLVLASSRPTAGTGRGPAQLRIRQITEALRVLQDEHLVAIPTDPAGRRKYDKWQLLSEAGGPDEPPYVAARLGKGAFYISRHFFTSLWIFALTDAEIAAFLMLSFLRARFPAKHDEKGVYVVDELRQAAFGLTRYAYRGHSALHRFRLIDRMPDPERDYETGRILDFRTKYAKGKGSIQPHTFKINDAALEAPALKKIHQVLAAPTQDDQLRRMGWG
jgi:hypothetical protein